MGPSAWPGRSDCSHGLRSEGVDLADADLVVGTSAGAAVGALLRSGIDTGIGGGAVDKPAAMSGMLPEPVGAPLPPRPDAESTAGLLDAMAAVASADDPRESNRALGRPASDAPTMP